MNKQKELSIIIPHKNIPDLLVRCLDSIPNNDLIEIIVIDDNSNPIHKKKIQEIERTNVSILYSNKNLTAGGARNLGLEYASGKWLMFSDADDFFHSNFYNIVSPFFESDYELVFFGMNSVYSDTLEPAKRGEGTLNLLKRAESGDNLVQEELRCKFLYPSCKLIKHSLVRNNQIRFDEVPASNDTMFGVKVATQAKKVFFCSEVIYCLTYRKGSLITSHEYENLKSRLIVSFELYKYLCKYRKEKYAQSILSHWWRLRKAGYDKLLINVGLLIRNYRLEAFVLDLKNAMKNRIIKKKGNRILI